MRLVRWMLGAGEAGGTLDRPAFEALMGLAWAEGVSVLVANRVAACEGVPADLRALCRGLAREQAAAELGRRARLQAVLARLGEAGSCVLVLKGAALAQWLYPAPSLREVGDVDLLFADRARAERAADALASLGYVTPYRPGRFRHGLVCRAADGRFELDLHWGLSDWPALAGLPDFGTFFKQRIGLPGLGDSAYGLGAQHALLHACVHRASNVSAGQDDRMKWLYDLHLLAGRLDETRGWPGFVAVAREAGVCGICAEGLAASAGVLGTAVPAEVVDALEVARRQEPLDAHRLADRRHVQRVNLRALDGWGTKIAWLWSRLLPPAGHLREFYGEQHGYVYLQWQRLLRIASRLVQK